MLVAAKSRATWTSAAEPRGVVGRQEAADAVAGLAREGVERVGHERLGGLARRDPLELGQPGVGLGEQGAAAGRVVAGEADLGGLDARA